MDDFVRRLVELLVHHPERFSRNRNFHAFDEPALRRARRIARQLRAVRDRIVNLPDDAIRLVQHPDGLELTIEDTAHNLTQVAYLSQDEFEILCQDPRMLPLKRLNK